MVSVFLSHSSKDKPFVRELARALADGGEIEVWLDEKEIAFGDSIVGKIGDALEADFVILVLSPDSVGSQWVKEEWTDAFWEQTNGRKTKLIPVLYRDCTIPRLVRNKKYLDLRTNQPQGFREIRTFLLTQKAVAPERVNFLPERPPLFVGREEELAGLRERLRVPGAVVHVAGMAGKGKTTLAKEFAHRYERDFESVYWLACESSSLAAIAAELARQLGLKLEGDLAEVVRELKGVCARKRCLVILDNVGEESPGELIPGGAGSVLVTTRRTNLQFLRYHQPQVLSLFTDDQCFEVFRRQIGAAEVERYEAKCLLLFQRLDHLPIAIALSAALIREDVRYTIAGLAKKLPANVTELIVKAIEALDAGPRQLLTAMAACAPEGFRLDLAAEIAGVDEESSLDALHPLVTRSLVEEIDRTDRRYRLHALVRESADPATLARKHAESVWRRFANWATNWRQCEQELSDFRLSIKWALINADISWTSALAFNGFSLMHRVGRLEEAFELSECFIRLFDEQGHVSALRACLQGQAAILKVWGRFQEALAIYQKNEAFCIEKGDKAGLARSYVDQAGIFQSWGRLEEALGLHKKEEEIYIQLDDLSGLQTSYGNQGLILQAWGRLEEALSLQLLKEGLCLKLGNKDGLQRSYGNQGIILHEMGRLEEAIVLYNRQEAICLDLGNKESLQRCYGNQALIVTLSGLLDEALALYQKQEEICLQLSSKRDLAFCYHGWGLLERALGNREAERAKLSAALAIFRELGMPRERDAVEAKLSSIEV